MPRIKPPFPAVQGVYAAPTIVNNIETMSTVPHIINQRRRVVRGMGVNRSTGTRIFSVSGNVERPGNYEIELGMTFRELIYDLAGGIKDGKELGFFIPGGASSPWLIEEHLDAPLDMDSVQSELKTMLGSGRGHGVRRDRRPAAGRVAHRQVLRPRVVRQVHAVP